MNREMGNKKKKRDEREKMGLNINRR